MENNNYMTNNRMNGMNGNCPYRNINTRSASSSCDTMTHSASDNYVVGMAYVPWQKWMNVYEPCKGFHQGTIFSDLDKPFEGGHCR